MMSNQGNLHSPFSKTTPFIQFSLNCSLFCSSLNKRRASKLKQHHRHTLLVHMVLEHHADRSTWCHFYHWTAVRNQSKCVISFFIYWTQPIEGVALSSHLLYKCMTVLITHKKGAILNCNYHSEILATTAAGTLLWHSIQYCKVWYSSVIRLNPIQSHSRHVVLTAIYRK